MNSLDEEGIILVRNIIKEMREKGTCILISSHYKEDPVYIQTVWGVGYKFNEKMCE